MKAVLIKALAVVALWGAGLNPSFAQGTEEAQHQAKLKELQATIALLKTEINKVKNSRDQLQDKLQGSEVDIASLLKKIERLKGDLASGKKQLSRLHKERAQLQRSKQQQQQHIAQHINSAYRMGQQGKLKLLLNQEDPAKLDRQLQYQQFIVAARNKKVQAYRQTIGQLDQLAIDIKEKTSQLKTSKLRFQERHQQLRLRQDQRQQTLATINQTLRNKDQQLAKSGRDQARLKHLLDQLSQALANIKLPNKSINFRKRKGKLSWPAQGKIRHRYGSQRPRGGLKWQGVFIQANDGMPVKAVHHGRVVFSDYLKGHGMLMIIDHGNDYMSLYAHNQTLFKETGEWVDNGETIAQVGNTGGLAEAGLYFEIRHRGNPSNPAKWCRG